MTVCFEAVKSCPSQIRLITIESQESLSKTRLFYQTEAAHLGTHNITAFFLNWLCCTLVRPLERGYSQRNCKQSGVERAYLICKARKDWSILTEEAAEGQRKFREK